jgi:hypothetical protein
LKTEDKNMIIQSGVLSYQLVHQIVTKSSPRLSYSAGASEGEQWQGRKIKVVHQLVQAESTQSSINKWCTAVERKKKGSGGPESGVSLPRMAQK